MKVSGLVLSCLAACALLWSAPASAQTVTPAPEYEKVFQRQTGWTGADGTYSYRLPDGRVVWGFSDTFFGDIVGGARQQPFRFVNNSLVVQDGSKFDFLEAPVFTPPEGAGWFWLFDGTSQGQILLGQFDGHGDGGFGFRQIGLWVARYRLSADAKKAQVSDLHSLPFYGKRATESITFGPAILETPSWLYLYGVQDQGGSRNSVLARVPNDSLGDPGAWRFFDGKDWCQDLWSVRPLFMGAAMEASVHLTRSGQYLYVGTDHAGLGAEIVARLAPSPEGPWSAAMPIHEAPEHGGDVFVYNAKAHPQASKDGRILISYNVNTSDLAKVVADADIYRPRFFWWTPPREGWLPAVPESPSKR